jgi:hypothetical protein
LRDRNHLKDPMTLSKAIQDMQGQPDRVIAEATGESIRKVRRYRQAAGIRGRSGDTSHWTRRDYLLAGAAGLLENEKWRQQGSV